MCKKVKILVAALYLILAAVFIYYATCCTFTLIRANTQSYLQGESLQYDFMGYSILARLYGGICLGVIAAGIVIGIVCRKFLAKNHQK